MSARTLDRWLAATLIVAALVLPASARAQQRTPTAAAATYFESYSFGTPLAAGAKTLTQLSVPLALRIPLGPLTLEGSGALARAALTSSDGSSTTLSGLTDTELRATLAFRGEAGSVALSAVGIAPTGREALTLSEAIVAGAIASDLMPFHVTSWGTGGGGGADLTVTRAVDMGSVGLTAGYRMAASFTPIDNLPAHYRPGSELRVRFAFDRTLANDRTVALQLGYSRFGEDQWDVLGAKGGLLRSGQRILALASYAAPIGRAVGTGYGGVLYRSGGALGELLRTGILSGIPAPPSETLVLAGWSARVPWAARVLVPGLDFRLLRRGDGTGQGYIGAVGVAAELPAGEGGTRIVPSARLRLGKLLVAEGLDSGVTGFEVGLAVRLGGAR